MEHYKSPLRNFSLGSMDAIEDYQDYNTTGYFYEDPIMSDFSKSIIYSVIFVISCIGLPLNGIVIWLLGFQIKRNPFTVLILNLAIADFVFLVFLTILCIDDFTEFIQPEIPWEIVFCLFNGTYINGLFLLTAISIDRCVAVLFPIWHRCSQPKYLSCAVCAFLWICSFLLIGVQQHLFLSHAIWNLHLVVTAVICLKLITTSTYFLKKENVFDSNELDDYLSPSASLNSSINPVIYFLVGRKK